MIYCPPLGGCIVLSPIHLSSVQCEPLTQQVAQLSQRDRASLRVIEYFKFLKII